MVSVFSPCLVLKEIGEEGRKGDREAVGLAGWKMIRNLGGCSSVFAFTPLAESFGALADTFMFAPDVPANAFAACE